MMKTVAVVLCLSVLVSSQDFMGGDGMGGLFAINLLNGRSPFDFSGLFGGGRPAGYPVQMPSGAGRTPQQQQQVAAMAAAAAAARGQQSPLGGLGGLLLLDGLGVM